jgi:hypothetical protein
VSKAILISANERVSVQPTFDPLTRVSAKRSQFNF